MQDLPAIRDLPQEGSNTLMRHGFLVHQDIFTPQSIPDPRYLDDISRIVSPLQISIELGDFELLQELVKHAQPENLRIGRISALEFFIRKYPPTMTWYAPNGLDMVKCLMSKSSLEDIHKVKGIVEAEKCSSVTFLKSPSLR